MIVLTFEDLYGGKLHAALDRQHPRNLFCVSRIYVASSGRPMQEPLAPMALFDETLYYDEIDGMIREMVAKEKLDDTRERLHGDN